MKAAEVFNLINVGGTDHLRKKLKKYGLEERMKVLKDCYPHVGSSNRSLKFFKENFSVELGALASVECDVDRAVQLYRRAEKNK